MGKEPGGTARGRGWRRGSTIAQGAEGIDKLSDVGRDMIVLCEYISPRSKHSSTLIPITLYANAKADAHHNAQIIN